jgi:malate dehydrogenase
MPTSIAILGASGAVGSTLTSHILRSGLLAPFDRLQLVGHGAVESERKLLGTRVDLLDAFDDERVEIEMVPRIADVDADVVIIAAGAGWSAQHKNRRDMAADNLEIFETIAEHCARSVPRALCIVVSNPIEIAVRILAGRVSRERVIGMGAQQDSLRFARAIARDLGISRHDVRASVLGEHGQAMVPLWSSVELLVSTQPVQHSLDRMKEMSASEPLHERITALREEVSELIETQRVPEAYEAARRALPDARVFIEPFITYHCVHSTPNATANATLQCLVAALTGDRRRVHGQVLLDGEVLGLRGVCGIPITLSRNGWKPDAVDSLTPAEREMLRQSVDSINEFALSLLSEPAAN